MADGGNSIVLVIVGGLGLWALFAVIRAAVYQGLVRFLREAARETEMREGHDVSRHVDRLAVHFARITRDPPPK